MRKQTMNDLSSWKMKKLIFINMKAPNFESLRCPKVSTFALTIPIRNDIPNYLAEADSLNYKSSIGFG